MPEKTQTFGRVLMAGGSGFPGYYVTKRFSEQADCSSVAVLSRDPDREPKVFLRILNR